MTKQTTGIIAKTLRDSVAMRWTMLVLLSGLTFSTYWFQDFYSGLKGLMETELGFTSEEYGRMLGLTTIANMFGMIMLGGIMLDKWGVRLAGIVFGGVAVLGSAINAMATAGVFGSDHTVMLNMMILGRILFGSGLEVACVVATRTSVKWFKGYELALAMAINMGFGRLGSAMGIALSPDLGGGSVPPAVTFAAVLVGISLILFLVYSVFDVRLDKQIQETDEADEDFKMSDLVKLITNKSFIYITLLCVSFYAAVFPFIQYASDLLINKFGFTETLPPEANLSLFGSVSLGNASVFIALFLFAVMVSAVPLNLKNKKLRYGIIVASVVVFGSFIASISTQLGVWLNNGPKTASLIPLGTIVFTPIFGSFVDKKGRAATLMILGSLLLIFAHVSLSVFNNVILAYMGLVSLGIAFSLVPAAMWPSVSKIVPENRLGTAYATMFTVQNWGLGAFFWGLGALLDYVNRDNLPAIKAGTAVYDYTIPILILVGLGVVSIFLAFMLLKADKEQGYGLELPSGQ